MAKKRNPGNRPRARLRGGEASGQNATVGIGGTDVSKAQSPPSEATGQGATIAQAVGEDTSVTQTGGEAAFVTEAAGERAAVAEAA
ncbi:MAG: hypothetical protein RMJ82_10655, partial [Gemmatales bacterium]|nr:hypothetical protein [Gemmatales bacterium]